jgi:predicted  nucleic acid-binding Zn-ribbon protein
MATMWWANQRVGLYDSDVGAKSIRTYRKKTKRKSAKRRQCASSATGGNDENNVSPSEHRAGASSKQQRALERKQQWAQRCEAFIEQQRVYWARVDQVQVAVERSAKPSSLKCYAAHVPHAAQMLPACNLSGIFQIDGGNGIEQAAGGDDYFFDAPSIRFPIQASMMHSHGTMPMCASVLVSASAIERSQLGVANASVRFSVRPSVLLERSQLNFAVQPLMLAATQQDDVCVEVSQFNFAVQPSMLAEQESDDDGANDEQSIVLNFAVPLAALTASEPDALCTQLNFAVPPSMLLGQDVQNDEPVQFNFAVPLELLHVDDSGAGDCADTSEAANFAIGVSQIVESDESVASVNETANFAIGVSQIVESDESVASVNETANFAIGVSQIVEPDESVANVNETANFAIGVSQIVESDESVASVNETANFAIGVSQIVESDESVANVNETANFAIGVSQIVESDESVANVNETANFAIGLSQLVEQSTSADDKASTLNFAMHASALLDEYNDDDASVVSQPSDLTRIGHPATRRSRRLATRTSK